MNRFNRRCLIISILCFTICAGILAYWVAPANGEMSAMLMYEPEMDAFEAGIGVKINTEYRLKSLAIGGSGNVMNQKKHNADDGYTWGYDVYGKFFPGEQYFIGGGWCWHGYRSKFDGPETWDKRANQPMIIAGIQSPDIEIRLTYWPRENDTPNRVTAYGIGVKHHLTNIMIMSVDLQAAEYTQSNDRKVDFGMAFSAGVYF